MRLNILLNDFGHLNPTSKAASLMLLYEARTSFALAIRIMVITEYTPQPTSFLKSDERYLGEIRTLSDRSSSVMPEEKFFDISSIALLT